MEYHPPPAKAKKTQPYTGIADYVKLFTDPAEEEDSPPPEPEVKETRAAKKARIAAEKAKENDAKIEEELKGWNPKEDPKLADSDPYKTLFVGRLSYDVDEAKLRREFERFGAVKSVHVVEDREGKPRGYAFVEFERGERHEARVQVGGWAQTRGQADPGGRRARPHRAGLETQAVRRRARRDPTRG